MEKYVKVNIQIIMSRRGFSIVSLSEKAQVSRKTLGKILDLSLTDYNPNFSTLYSISSALDISIPTLFRRSEKLSFPEENVLLKEEYLDILIGNFSRFFNGKSQKSVSVEPGLSESAISKLQNKANLNPSFFTIKTISEITEVDMEKLFIRGDDIH